MRHVRTELSRQGVGCPGSTTSSQAFRVYPLLLLPGAVSTRSGHDQAAAVIEAGIPALERQALWDYKYIKPPGRMWPANQRTPNVSDKFRRTWERARCRPSYKTHSLRSNSSRGPAPYDALDTPSHLSRRREGCHWFRDRQAAIVSSTNGNY